jgi:hypothetical protein
MPFGRQPWAMASKIYMSEEQHQFMRLLGQLPARLTAEQAAWVVNCQPHDVPILVAARLLKPLGNPPPSSVKYFAASELLEQAKDRTWLAKVTNALNQHWQRKNAGKKNRLALSPANGHNPSAHDADGNHTAGAGFIAARSS